jgi:RNA recognition motif-containing protein
VDYKNKESALLAIKFLNGQAFLHGSRIPIEVRFKEKKYNSFMSKKNAKEDLDPFAVTIDNVYLEVFADGKHYYYNYITRASSYETPPPGSKIYTGTTPDAFYIQEGINSLNDMHTSNRKLGPPGSNLFLFHLPNDMKDSELYNHFKNFGNIYSTRVMTEKNGKSKGIGFVSFDNPKSAQDAIEEMNGFEVRGKRLKVELNKKDERAITNNVSSLVQARYDF